MSQATTVATTSPSIAMTSLSYLRAKHMSFLVVVLEPIRNPCYAVSRYLKECWLGEGASRRSMRPMDAT